MRTGTLVVCLALVGSASAGRADVKTAPAKKEGPTYQVPFRLTASLHVLVRVKINGKGPLNLIVDTGAPLVFVTKEAAKKVGLQAGKSGWAVVERLEVEGGPRQEKVRVRVATPFQLEGMNAMGLAGAELHGILGYSLLAHYRLEFDFTRDRLSWTKLAFDPPAPRPLGKKGAEPPDLGFVASLMKALSFLAGRPPEPIVTPRGFLGIELAEHKGQVTVWAVLEKSPAAEAGLKVGDWITNVQGHPVRTVADVRRQTGRLTPGQPVRLTLDRAGLAIKMDITAGQGF